MNRETAGCCLRTSYGWPLSIVSRGPAKNEHLSAKGPEYDSLGQRSRKSVSFWRQALKARDERSPKAFSGEHPHQLSLHFVAPIYFALSALDIIVASYPGALPQAFASRTLGALVPVPRSGGARLLIENHTSIIGKTSHHRG